MTTVPKCPVQCLTLLRAMLISPIARAMVFQCQRCPCPFWVILVHHILDVSSGTQWTVSSCFLAEKGMNPHSKVGAEASDRAGFQSRLLTYKLCGLGQVTASLRLSILVSETCHPSACPLGLLSYSMSHCIQRWHCHRYLQKGSVNQQELSPGLCASLSLCMGPLTPSGLHLPGISQVPCCSQTAHASACPTRELRTRGHLHQRDPGGHLFCPALSLGALVSPHYSPSHPSSWPAPEDIPGNNPGWNVCSKCPA